MKRVGHSLVRVAYVCGARMCCDGKEIVNSLGWNTRTVAFTQGDVWCAVLRHYPARQTFRSAAIHVASAGILQMDEEF